MKRILSAIFISLILLQQTMACVIPDRCNLPNCTDFTMRTENETVFLNITYSGQGEKVNINNCVEESSGFYVCDPSWEDYTGLHPFNRVPFVACPVIAYVPAITDNEGNTIEENRLFIKTSILPIHIEKEQESRRSVYMIKVFLAILLIAAIVGVILKRRR